jgi:hypothetical protein
MFSAANVRYWPKADISICTAMSAFGGKADMAQMGLGVGSTRLPQVNTRSSTCLVGGSSVQLGAGVSENRMIAEPHQQPHDKDRSKGERRRDEKALDEALKNTFPASDPVSVQQPVST